MANAHIEITGTGSRYAAEMRRFVDALRAIVNQAEDLKAIGDQIALGGDWAALATYLGLSGESAETDAQAVYNLLGSVNTELAGPFTAQFLSRLG